MSTITTVTLRIGGMNCQHCAKTVAASASRVAGVSKAFVDLDHGTLTITVDAERQADILREVCAGITEAGYEPEKV